MKLNVLIENAGPNWCAAPLTDELGAVVVAGANREETMVKFCEVLEWHLSEMRENGEDVPEIDSIEFHETIPFPMALAA